MHRPRLVRLTALAAFGVAAVAYLLPFIAITTYTTSGLDLVLTSFLMASTLPLNMSRYGQAFLLTFLLTFGTFTVALLLAGIGFAFGLTGSRRAPAIGVVCGALGSALLVTGYLYWRQYLPFAVGIYIAIIGLLIATALSAVGFLQTAASSRE